MNNMISASLWARAQETPKNGANTFFTKARKAHGFLMSPASNDHGFLEQISLEEIPPADQPVAVEPADPPAMDAG